MRNTLLISLLFLLLSFQRKKIFEKKNIIINLLCEQFNQQYHSSPFSNSQFAIRNSQYIFLTAQDKAVRFFFNFFILLFSPFRVGFNPSICGCSPFTLVLNPSTMGFIPNCLGLNPKAVGTIPFGSGFIPNDLGLKQTHPFNSPQGENYFAATLPSREAGWVLYFKLNFLTSKNKF